MIAWCTFSMVMKYLMIIAHLFSCDWIENKTFLKNKSWLSTCIVSKTTTLYHHMMNSICKSGLRQNSKKWNAWKCQIKGCWIWCNETHLSKSFRYGGSILHCQKKGKMIVLISREGCSIKKLNFLNHSVYLSNLFSLHCSVLAYWRKLC